jgi:hypothetical protein
MTIEILGLLILAVVLAVVLFAYDRSLREISGLKKDRMNFEQRARRRMLRTMREARDRAVEIVGQAQLDADKLRQVMDEEMDKLAKEQLSDYKETIQTISKDLEDEVKNEALEMEKVTAKRMEEDYLVAKKQLEEYRLAKYKQIEEEAVAALEEVGKRLVGQTLGFREHTDLIISALEKAKLQNVI